MQRDVGANQRGELAGFSLARAEELVKVGAAEVVCTFDPVTHRFDPSNESLVALEVAVDPAAPGADVSVSLVETVPPEETALKVGSVVEASAKPGQRMTIVRIDGELAESAWFVDATAHSDVFELGSLVAVEPAPQS